MFLNRVNERFILIDLSQLLFARFLCLLLLGGASWHTVLPTRSVHAVHMRFRELTLAISHIGLFTNLL